MMLQISIHIPRVGDDVVIASDEWGIRLFQSTSPVWGMTADALLRSGFPCISIHIPRVGDDEDWRGGGGIATISIHIPRVGDDW